ncbi:MAG: ribosome biogenesis/translation initiation ATPase RLI [archaeon]
MSRIAVVDKEKCNTDKCSYECIKACPVNRQDDDCIVLNDKKTSINISEDLCTGCGLCIKRCPFGAISIINEPEEIGEPIHRYGMNDFRVYGLPVPREGVVGLIGPNAIGKSTLVKILSGNLKPNFGRYNEDVDWEFILNQFKGNEIHDYFKKIKSGELKTAYKPQVVTSIPKTQEGKVSDLLESVNERGNKINELKEKLNLDKCWNRDIGDISGGELQRIAITATLLKEADLYFIDEPSSYLDIKQRLRTAEVISELGEDKKVMIVEHDLAILDYLTDYVYVLYGKPSVFGAVSSLKSSRKGINQFLEGFLEEENTRIRPQEIVFETNPPSTHYKGEESVSYPSFEKKYHEFELESNEGEIKRGEVIGIIGENAIGKTTFVKVLAGKEDPEKGEIGLNADISYKPQYVDFGSSKMTVEQFIATRKNFDKKLFNSRLKPLVEDLYPKKLGELSGGEQQRVAVTVALGNKSDLCLLDEPSAFLDIEQRLKVSKVIKRAADDKGISVLVVDHDLLFQDMVSNRLMMFTGEPGKRGKANSPVDMREGMSNFLEMMDITMRREPRTGRPRINKKGSQKDKEQKKKREYYYTTN